MEQKRHEEARSPRERVARLRTVFARGLSYWKGSLLVLLFAAGIALAVAMKVERVYRTECTIFAKERIRTDDQEESSTSHEAMARQSARLKDMLTTRARLESTIREFRLYPETTATKTMLDAVEQMKPHVGFRALEGGQYVISFDGDDPQTVQKVTQYLADSLIKEYAAGGVSDLQSESDFLGEEERGSLEGLETATTGLARFLAAHPEFALVAKQATTATAFGAGPASSAQLTPLTPLTVPQSPTDAVTADPGLAALLRERARLESEARTAATVSRGIAPASTSKTQLDEQTTQAQAEVEAAAKRVAETQADVASKSNLTEDHPDMRAARLAADAAARQLHEARVRLGALQQSAASGAAADPSAPSNPATRLRLVDAQIAARRARPPGTDGAASRPTDSPVVRTVVELETDWQRMVRALNEAKARHENLKLRAERVKLALEAARAQASERIAIIDPPYRPTHPSKGGRSKVAFGGLATACLLALGYAALRMTLDDTLVDAEDIEALEVAGVLGVVPRIRLRALEGLRRGAV